MREKPLRGPFHGEPREMPSYGFSRNKMIIPPQYKAVVSWYFYANAVHASCDSPHPPPRQQK